MGNRGGARDGLYRGRPARVQWSSTSADQSKTVSTARCFAGFLNVLGAIELSDDLADARSEELAATLIPVIRRVGGEVEKEFHIGLIGAHRVPRQVLDPTQVAEEVIGISGGPLPGMGADKRGHAQHRASPPLDSGGAKSLRELLALPAGQHVSQKRVWFRCRGGRQPAHSAYIIVHNAPSLDANIADRMHDMQETGVNSQVTSRV